MSDTIEPHIDIVSVQTISGDVEMAAIGTHWVGHIAVIGEPSRTVGHNAICRFVERERVGHITIERLVPRLVVVQSPYLPAARHIDVRPSGIIVFFCTHSRCCLRRCVHPLELPNAVERLIIGGQRQVVLGHISLVSHRQRNGMGRLTIHARYLRVIPFFSRLCESSQYECECRNCENAFFHTKSILMVSWKC